VQPLPRFVMKVPRCRRGYENVVNIIRRGGGRDCAGNVHTKRRTSSMFECGAGFCCSFFCLFLLFALDCSRWGHTCNTDHDKPPIYIYDRTNVPTPLDKMQKKKEPLKSSRTKEKKGERQLEKGVAVSVSSHYVCDRGAHTRKLRSPSRQPKQTRGASSRHPPQRSFDDANQVYRYAHTHTHTQGERERNNSYKYKSEEEEVVTATECNGSPKKKKTFFLLWWWSFLVSSCC
jgi:hypothetical protein